MNPTLIEQLPKEKLTLAQETECATSAAGRERLVLHTMQDAFYYAKKVCQSALPDDEIFSLCYTALVDAARNYIPRKNMAHADSRFMGYAKPYVRGQICKMWRSKDTVRNGDTISLDGAPINPSDDDGYIDDDQFWTIFGVVDPAYEEMDLRERWAIASEVINRLLSHQEKMVIDLFYRGGFNFDRIGKLLGVSRSAIQNTHARALKKVRCDLFKNKKLFDV